MTTTADRARERLSTFIADGQSKAAHGLEALQREYLHRTDYAVKSAALAFIPEVEIAGVPYKIAVGFDGRTVAPTSYAWGQLYGNAKIPQAYAETLLADKQADLLALNLSTRIPSTADGFLVRVVDDQVAKAFLSPSYRRIDASVIFEDFLRATLAQGLVPHSGEVTDTRAHLSMIEQDIVEIFPGEHIVRGVELRSSDYGKGAVQIALQVIRLLCSNGAIGSDMFRKVHLGSRFDIDAIEGASVTLSKETIELDTKTIRSAMTDVMGSTKKHLDGMVEAIRGRVVTGEKFNFRDALAGLTRKGLTKATVEKVKALYEAEVPVEALPSEPGSWRFSNVLSLLANTEKTPDARKELQEVAFDLIAPKVIDVN